MVQGLQDIDKLKSQMQDIQVPLEVFEYVLQFYTCHTKRYPYTYIN